MLIALWILVALLTIAFLGAGFLKLLKPRTALIEGGMPWAEDFPPSAIKGIALLEIIGALGLILPLITGIAPALTPIAAAGLAVVMLGAVVVHQRRHEPIIPPAALAALSTTTAVLGFATLS